MKTKHLVIGALEQSLPIINCQFHLMLSAFVSIPAVKMDWITSGMKTVVVVSTKVAANALVPGLGAADEFAPHMPTIKVIKWEL